MFWGLVGPWGVLVRWGGGSGGYDVGRGGYSVNGEFEGYLGEVGGCAGSAFCCVALRRLGGEESSGAGEMIVMGTYRSVGDARTSAWVWNRG